jgi:hypothetical protein
MHALEDRPKVSDPPPPDTEVLIEEARRRHRHRQIAFSALLILVLGTALAYGLGGFSGSRHLTPSPSGTPAPTSALAGSTNQRGVLAINVPGLFGTRSEPPIGLVIAFGAGSAWVLGENGTVRLSGATGRIEATVPIKGFAENLAFTDGHLWVESVIIGAGGYLVSEVDPSTNTVLRRTVIDRAQIQQGVAGSFQTLAAENGELYLELGSTVVKIDAATGAVVSTERGSRLFERINGSDETIPEHGALGSANIADATILGSHVWATSATAVNAPTSKSFGQLRWELNDYATRTGTKLAVSVPNVWLVAAGNGQLWGIEQTIASNYRDTLVKINPSNGRIERQVTLPTSAGGSNLALSITGGAVWVVESTAKTVFRVTT